MKTVSVTYIGHPTNAKLKPTSTALLHAANRTFSEEVNTTNAFIYESDPMFIYMLLKQLLTNSTHDQLIITDELTCSLIQLLDQAYVDSGKPKLWGSYTLVQFLNGELKSFNQTMGIYDHQIHYTNVYSQKGSSLVETLKVRALV